MFCSCRIAKSAGRSKLYWFNFSSECNASSKPEIKLIIHCYMQYAIRDIGYQSFIFNFM